jgi:hypothetical protein
MINSDQFDHDSTRKADPLLRQIVRKRYKILNIMLSEGEASAFPKLTKSRSFGSPHDDKPFSVALFGALRICGDFYRGPLEQLRLLP